MCIGLIQNPHLLIRLYTLWDKEIGPAEAAQLPKKWMLITLRHIDYKFISAFMAILLNDKTMLERMYVQTSDPKLKI